MTNRTTRSPNRSSVIRAAALLLAGLASSMIGAPVFAADGSAPPEPDGYRMADFRAPVPGTLRGATVIDTEGAESLFDAKRAVFVDVMPLAPKPAKLPKGTVWRDPPRNGIPGSVWLPDTGYGALSPDMERYFRDGLVRATGGDKGRPLVFFCLRDCWMSWNAAKRALGAGHTAVHWYPDGTDGWSEFNLPLERRTPEPRPSQQAE